MSRASRLCSKCFCPVEELEKGNVVFRLGGDDSRQDSRRKIGGIGWEVFLGKIVVMVCNIEGHIILF